MGTGEKLLLFGGLPSAYLDEWHITGDLVIAEPKLDVRFETVPHDELLARYSLPGEHEAVEAARLARELIEGASDAGPEALPPAPPEEEVLKATRFYVAMKGITEEREGQAVTIVCGPWIGGEELPVPCVALMLFQERGIPAACQGDIDALLTMLLFKRIAGLPSFMGGAVDVGERLGISHCVLCRNMLGPNGEMQAYVLSNYHGRKDSPTVWTDAPVGETATLARLTRNLERLLLTTGTVVATETGDRRCRNVLVLDVPDRDQVFDAVMGVQNHYVVAYGDHRQALTELAEAKQIEVVRLEKE
jgi:L-fucose isomerase-like protein